MLTVEQIIRCQFFKINFSTFHFNINILQTFFDRHSTFFLFQFKFLTFNFLISYISIPIFFFMYKHLLVFHLLTFLLHFVDECQTFLRVNTFVCIQFFTWHFKIFIFPLKFLTLQFFQIKLLTFPWLANVGLFAILFTFSSSLNSTDYFFLHFTFFVTFTFLHFSHYLHCFCIPPPLFTVNLFKITD